MSTADLLNSIEYQPNPVQELQGTDFESNSVRLINKECGVILFYDASNTSQSFRSVFLGAAKEIVAPNMWAINLSIHREIAKRFLNLRQDGNDLRWAYLRSIPFILAYKNGSPKGFYNGALTVQNLRDYALTLACSPNYYEPVNEFGPGPIDGQNISLTNRQPYRPKETSFDFTGTAPEGVAVTSPASPNNTKSGVVTPPSLANKPVMVNPDIRLV